MVGKVIPTGAHQGPATITLAYEEENNWVRVYVGYHTLCMVVKARKNQGKGWQYAIVRFDPACDVFTSNQAANILNELFKQAGAINPLVRPEDVGSLIDEAENIPDPTN